MREIKFRGKRKDNNQMIYGELCIYDDIIFFIGVAKTIFQIRNGVFIPNIVWYEVLPESVGQFTGSLDKNKNEIYEGDRCEVENGDEFYMGVVIFDNGCFSLKIDDRTKKSKFTKTYFEYDIGQTPELYNFKNISIVGNIYENVDLLK